MNDRQSRNRNFVFTWNNYPADAEHILRGKQSRYMAFGREVGANGTPHLQGMVCFANARTARSVRNSLPGCHIEIMRGTPTQSRTYCSKDGDFVEWGDLPVDKVSQSKQQKEEYQFAWDLAKENKIEEVDVELRLRYYRVLKDVAKDFGAKPPDLTTVCGLWVWGEPGIGKSYAVKTRFPDAYRKDASKWWDAYNGESEAWLDDLDPTASGWIARLLKIWADENAFMAQNKGGARYIRPARFIVTSNYRINEMGFNRQDLAAICRRFREVHYTIRGQAIVEEPILPEPVSEEEVDEDELSLDLLSI